MRFLFCILFLFLGVRVSDSFSACTFGELKPVAKTDVKIQRLSGSCGPTWTVLVDGEKIKVPAGLRVIRLDQSNGPQILFPFGGKVLKGKIAEEAFKCHGLGAAENLAAFKEEAGLAIALVKTIDRHKKEAFLEEVKKIEFKLEKLTKGQRSFEKLALQWKRLFLFSPENKVHRTKKLKSLISASYDPLLSDQRRMSASTLIVPLSQAWFKSSPKLKQFYQKVWVQSNKDIRINGGASGEGLSYNPNQAGASENYLEMMELFNLTEKFIRESKDQKLLLAPEYKWLVEENKKGYLNYSRMIFMGPETWERMTLEHPWADYIPVDQSLGGLYSDYLLSVLIHEINVNSMGYLLTDTHSEFEQNAAMWECLKKKPISHLSQDPKSLQSALGLNPQISIIYLKMILDLWDQQNP